MSDTAQLFLDSRCELGEGPLWNHLLKRLFWFDILNKTLFSATADGEMVDRFIFDEYVSAAGIIDADNLAIATGAGIVRLTLSTNARELIAPLEADKPANRPNDGRISPTGDFWIGTMAQRDAGAHASGSLYLVRGGSTEKLLPDINVPNCTSFSPDGRTAYFTNSVKRVVRKVALGTDGKPGGEWQDHIHVPDQSEPDGAVVDTEGYLWIAHWAGSRLVRYAPDGSIDRTIAVPVIKPTCPAFGGADLRTIYITTARQGMTPAELEAQPLSGGVFSIRVDVPGQPESLFKA